jgi:tetratricopeptide (TPR) repeat protein
MQILVVRCLHDGFPSSYDTCQAHNALVRGDYSDAIRLYERALTETRGENLSSWNIDLTIRMPLSDALYRAHRIHEAKVLWRSLIAGKAQDDGTNAVLANNFHSALVAYATSPPGFNYIFFRESGAAYNLQRGMNAAALDDIANARRFLEYSLECSDMFSVPHLMLGVLDAKDGDYTSARREWLADIEGGEPDPPDTASITSAQYDAMRLLLRFD